MKKKRKRLSLRRRLLIGIAVIGAVLVALCACMIATTTAIACHIVEEPPSPAPVEMVRQWYKGTPAFCVPELYHYIYEEN